MKLFLLLPISRAKTTIEGTEYKVSLWKTCSPNGCIEIGRTMAYLKNATKQFKNEADDERNGAIAGLVSLTVACQVGLQSLTLSVV